MVIVSKNSFLNIFFVKLNIVIKLLFCKLNQKILVIFRDASGSGGFVVQGPGEYSEESTFSIRTIFPTRKRTRKGRGPRFKKGFFSKQYAKSQR